MVNNSLPLMDASPLPMVDDSLPTMDMFERQEEEDWARMAKAAHDFDILQEQDFYRKQDMEYLEATRSPRRSRSPALYRRCSGEGGKERRW
eukprot:6067935-Alexandrium_andersonii.AAC.1